MADRQAIIIGYVENHGTSRRLRQQAQKAVAKGAFLVCADGGGAVAVDWKLKPDLLLGDMDSIDPQILAALEAATVPTQRFPAAKDETDLELAISAAIAQGCQQITILGGIGGRLDQTLSNLFLLGFSKFVKTGAELVLSGEQEEVHLLRGTGSLQIVGEPGELVSLLAISEQVKGIRTHNLLYPLRNETLFFGSTRGISNVISSSPAQVEIKTGLLFVVHRVATLNTEIKP